MACIRASGSSELDRQLLQRRYGGFVLPLIKEPSGGVALPAVGMLYKRDQKPPWLPPPASAVAAAGTHPVRRDKCDRDRGRSSDRDAF